MKFKSNIFKNISWLFGDHMITFVGSFFISIWLARYLGPTKLGIYSYALAIYSIAASLSKLGLGGIAIKEIVSTKKLNKSISTIFLLKLVGALIALAISTLYIFIIAENGEKALLSYIILISLFFIPFSVMDNYFDAMVKSKYKVISRKTGFLVRSSLVILFILLKLELLYIACIIVIEQLISTLMLTYYFFRHEVNIKFLFDKTLAKKLLSNSWPLIISSIGAILYLKVDQIMIVDMIDNKAGGIYSVAIKYTSIFYFLHSIVITSFFPKLVKEKENNQEKYIQMFTRLGALLFYLGVAIILGTYLFIGKFILITYGEAYLSVVPIIKVHILTLPLVFFGAILSKWLIIEDLTKFSILRHLMGLIVNLCLNFMLIPKFGGVGAAIASFAALFFSVIVILFFHRKLMILFKILIGGIQLPFIYLKSNKI